MTAPTPTRLPDHLLAFALGLGLFTVMDIVVLVLLDTAGSLTTGLAFVGLTAAVAALLYRRGGRGHAVGVAVGFALMTLLTGGECTGFTTLQYGSAGGLVYLVITVLALVIAGIVRSVTPRERAP